MIVDGRGLFVSDGMLRIKYPERMHHIDTFLDVYENTERISDHFKDVGG